MQTKNIASSNGILQVINNPIRYSDLKPHAPISKKNDFRE